MKQSALPLDRLPPNVLLEDQHYLGRAHRGQWTYQDEFGVMVWANPNAAYLPQHTWFELVRWCLLGVRNGGSQQWGRVKRILIAEFPHITTCVSYSDPEQGHTGALYKACNWIEAPTWRNFKPPPSGNGSWDGVKQQSVKHRWVFPLREDMNRAEILRVKV